MKTTRNTHDLVTGDARTLLVTLTLNGAPLVIPPGSSVKAVLQSADMSPVTCLESEIGAAWASGIVAVPLSATDTAKLTPSARYTLEVQVAGFGTWFSDNLEVRRGEIG